MPSVKLPDFAFATFQSDIWHFAAVVVVTVLVVPVPCSLWYRHERQKQRDAHEIARITAETARLNATNKRIGKGKKP